MFIAEGEWRRVESDVVTLDVVLPPERGAYRVYISAVNEASGWAYQRGKLFLVLDAFVERGQASVVEGPRETTMRALRRQARRRQIRLAFTLPFRTISGNRSLLSSMVRRDILARYRGSFGDVLWTVLNPLLLIGTYFVVFGVFLQSKFGPDNSRTGFVLYLLAGILPWLAFSEAVGRSPHVMLEHRNFIKKLVFPVEILPVTQTISALITEGFALAIFIVALVIVRGSMPPTALFLPVLLIPQLMFTLGIAWFLSALGVFLRDLSQIISFLLTLWFWLTPICYPETTIQGGFARILTKNPIYTLVRGYRATLLEGSPPEFHSLWKLWLVSGVVFVLGYAWFHKLRKSFADVI